jgi:hypothetical protein
MQYSTPSDGRATPEDWPEPASGVFVPEDDSDPRSLVAFALVEWLSQHVTNVDIRSCHEAADAALDRLEDAMIDDGGDWRVP